MFGVYPYTVLTERQRRAMEAAGLDCEPQTAKKLVSAFITNYLNNQQQRNSP